MDALLDQPIDVAPGFRLVDFAVRLKGNDVRSEYALYLLGPCYFPVFGDSVGRE